MTKKDVSEKQIFTMGYVIPTLDKNHINLYDKVSLMDADILLISPDNLEPRGSYISFTSSDGGCYNIETSREYIQKMGHLKKEILDHLNVGKNVFVFLTETEQYSLASGVTSTKGTNSYTTQTYSNYEFLPISIGKLTSARGKRITFSGNPLFNDFNTHFNKDLEYQIYIENPSGDVIFTGTDKTKVLGAVYRVGNGHLVVLPYLNYNEKDFTETDKKTNKAYWTDAALVFGKSLMKTLVDIDKNLHKSGDKTPPPAWVDDQALQTVEEQTLRKELKENSRKIDKLVTRNNELLIEIENVGQLKDLLFEKGKPLENAIGQALEILGYKAENYNDGNLEIDHVIISPENDRFIGEAEGKDTSAVNIDKLRQLVVNIQEDVMREEVEKPATGILFGNGFRLTKPSDREEQFTTKCLTTVKSSNCVLIKTSDLFLVAKYVKETGDQNFAKYCRDSIKASIGLIVKFPDIPSH